MLFNTDATLGYLIGTLLPLLVALVTKQTTHPALKGFVLALLATITGVLAQWLNADQNHVMFHWQLAVASAAFTFAVSQSSHTGIWRNTKLRAILQLFGVHDPVAGANHEAGSNATPGASGG
jgi:hypothetical protein